MTASYLSWRGCPVEEMWDNCKLLILPIVSGFVVCGKALHVTESAQPLRLLRHLAGDRQC